MHGASHLEALQQCELERHLESDAASWWHSQSSFLEHIPAGRLTRTWGHSCVSLKKITAHRLHNLARVRVSGDVDLDGR